MYCWMLKEILLVELDVPELDEYDALEVSALDDVVNELVAVDPKPFLAALFSNVTVATPPSRRTTITTVTATREMADLSRGGFGGTRTEVLNRM